MLGDLIDDLRQAKPRRRIVGAQLVERRIGERAARPRRRRAARYDDHGVRLLIELLTVHQPMAPASTKYTASNTSVFFSARRIDGTMSDHRGRRVLHAAGTVAQGSALSSAR